MPTDARSSAAAPDSLELRREVGRVRRRARIVLLAGAVVAALAADVWYEIFTFGIWWYSRVNVYFPLFFFVALAVFAVGVARRTATLPLSTALDEKFSLKARLAAASRFERLSRVPEDLREAQARETLRAVDFSRLRSSYRLRPWGAIAWLIVGSGIAGLLMHRFPAVFNPNNLVFRQGRVVFMTVKSISNKAANGGAGAGGDPPRQFPAGHPQVALVLKDSPDREAPPGAQPSGSTGEKPPPGGGNRSGDETEPGGKPPTHPEPSPDRKSPDADRSGAGKEARPGSADGSTRSRPVSLEETDGISPPTARPESGMAGPAMDLRGPDGGPSLPPLPFVRLLGGAQPGALFDPETLNIVLEAYPPKYREHLESYLKILQSLSERPNGS
ncbi:MAG: hypothetical protein ACYC9Y_04605 [Candidatus Methylomirabilia bacterium]